jgi:hypothetical protein
MKETAMINVIIIACIGVIAGLICGSSERGLP